MHENDLVALLTALPHLGINRGDVGTVAHVYPSGTQAEVEFVNANGETVAVETLTTDQVQLVDESRTILHFTDRID